MVHDINHQSELWHQRFAHLHYDALPKVRRMVSKMPKVQTKHDGVCLGCVSGKKSRGPLPYSKSRNIDIL